MCELIDDWGAPLGFQKKACQCPHIDTDLYAFDRECNLVFDLAPGDFDRSLMQAPPMMAMRAQAWSIQFIHTSLFLCIYMGILMNNPS